MYDTLEVTYELEPPYTLEYIDKEYAISPMGKPKGFVEFVIKHDINKMTLNISQTDLIVKITKYFNDYIEPFMKSSAPDIPQKGVLTKQEMATIIPKYLQRWYQCGV